MNDFPLFTEKLYQQQHRLFVDDFTNFPGKEKPHKYQKLADRTENIDNLCILLHYDSFIPGKAATKKNGNKKNGIKKNDHKKPVFLIVTSIFNSPEILFLPIQDNFVNNLRQKGEIYIINWHCTDFLLNLDDYTLAVEKIIILLSDRTGQKINVIGHCIGGNIALAGTVLQQDRLRSLTLLTTPWNYSHFQKFFNIYQHSNLPKIIEKLPVIPKIYIQIIFFLLFPTQFANKVDKYYYASPKNKIIYLQIESWLQSTKDIAKSTYNQIIKNLIKENQPYNNRWYIKGLKIDITTVNIPISIIAATEDKLAPIESILPLQKLLKNSILIKVPGGHINYLIKKNSDFFSKYNSWLKKLVS